MNAADLTTLAPLTGITATDLLALAPLIILSVTAAVVMVATPLGRSHRLVFTLTLAGLAAAMGAIALAAPLASPPRQVTPLLVVDRYAIFYTGLILAAAAAVALLSYGYNKNRPVKRCEFYVLLVLATAGAAVLAASSHFASFFLGVELLSVSLYAMIAYQRRSLPGIEAAMKYLVIAGASSGFLLFGMALVYADLGTMEFAAVAARAAAAPMGLLTAVGFAMILAGVGFKLAVVPFHMWTPDVYEGAPAPVTAFIATVSKGAVFALLLRYLGPVAIRQHAWLLAALTAVAVASMLGGNLLALRQRNLKRLLAYSSIAHLGYLVVALVASGPAEDGAAGDGGSRAAAAVAFYLVAYFVTTLGAFGVITVLSTKDPDVGSLDELRGLAWRRPALAAVLVAMLLSLAGIPATAGFIGKFYVLTAGVATSLWLMVAVLVISSAIGLAYYLRVIAALFGRPEEAAPAGSAGLSFGPTEATALRGGSGDPPRKAGDPLRNAGDPPRKEGDPLRNAGDPSRKRNMAGGIALAVLLVALVALGVYPSPLVDLIQAMVAGLSWPH